MISAAPCTPEQAAAWLRPVLAAKANPKGEGTMAEMLLGRCFMVYQGDSPIAAYVLRGQGNEVWVQAGAGRANVDLCDVFDDLIVQHAAGFESVAFRTYRRGFVKKALQRGYQVADESDGYTMRKKLK